MPTWNLSIYDPHLSLVDKKALVGDVRAEEIASKFLEGMKDSEHFVLLKLLDTDSGELTIFPKDEPAEEPLPVLEERLEEFLASELWLESIKLAEAILDGPHGELPEAQLLAVSVYERLGWHDLAIQLFQSLCQGAQQPILATSQVRLARLLTGVDPEQAQALLDSALAFEGLPAAQRIDGLMMLGELAASEEAIKLIRQARTLAVEQYGRLHPICGSILGREGQLLEESQPNAAIEAYAAAYGVFLELGDRRVFPALESLILLYLKSGQAEQAFRDSTRAIQLIEQDPTSAPLMVTYLVLNAQALAQDGKADLSKAVMQRAQALDSDKAFQIWSELQQMLLKSPAS